MKSIRDYVICDGILEFRANRNRGDVLDEFPRKPVRHDIIEFLESKGFESVKSGSALNLLRNDILKDRYTVGGYGDKPSSHWVAFSSKNSIYSYIVFTDTGIGKYHAIDFGYVDTRAKWWRCEDYDEFLSVLKRDFGW